MYLMYYLISVYFSINSGIVGYSVGSDWEGTWLDWLIHILGIFIALPYIILVYGFYFLREVLNTIDNYFAIGFIWKIRNGYFLDVDKDILKNLKKKKDKLLNEEPNLNFNQRRFIYCLNRVEEVLEEHAKTKEIDRDTIIRLINRKCPIVLDIGSYDGKSMNDILRYSYENYQLHCFEADPRSIKLFKEMQRGNKNIKLYPFAIGNIDGEIDFHLSDSETRRHTHNKDSWSASSSIKKPKEHLELFPDVKFENVIKVNCVRLDVWYKFHLEDSIIDFVWADVNGAEEDLIKGGFNVLIHCVRFLYIEFSNKELYENSINQNQLLELLPMYEVINIFNFRGNFGNVLLKNTNL